jgi:hypothetical protein
MGHDGCALKEPRPGGARTALIDAMSHLCPPPAFVSLLVERSSWGRPFQVRYHATLIV